MSKNEEGYRSISSEPVDRWMILVRTKEGKPSVFFRSGNGYTEEEAREEAESVEEGCAFVALKMVSFFHGPLGIMLDTLFELGDREKDNLMTWMSKVVEGAVSEYENK